MATTETRRAAALRRGELSAQWRGVISRANRRLRQEAGGEESGNLPLAQSSALSAIALHGPLSPTGVAEQEKISKPTATRLIAQLRANGLVEIVPDPADKRSYRLTVSTKGKRVRAGRLSRKSAYLDGLFDRASARELAVLQDAADILSRLMAQEQRP